MAFVGFKSNQNLAWRSDHILCIENRGTNRLSKIYCCILKLDFCSGKKLGLVIASRIFGYTMCPSGNVSLMLATQKHRRFPQIQLQNRPMRCLRTHHGRCVSTMLILPSLPTPQVRISNPNAIYARYILKPFSYAPTFILPSISMPQTDTLAPRPGP